MSITRTEKSVDGFINPERFDLLIKRKFLESYDKGGKNYAKWRDIYEKTIVLRSIGVEPQNPSGDFIEKTNPKDFVEKFINSYLYFKSKPTEIEITINENSKMVDGAHRLAIALHLKKQSIKVKSIKGIRDSAPWGVDIVSSDLFTLAEKIALIELYLSTFKNSNIIILWGRQPKSLIASEFRRVGLSEVANFSINFEADLFAFSNLVYELYQTQSDNAVIRHKFFDLVKTDLSLRVTLVTSEATSGYSKVYDQSIQFKENFRQIPRINGAQIQFNAVHCADDYNEKSYIVKILKSLAQNKHYERVGFSPSAKMLNLVKELKQTMLEHNIDSEDYCVVGSGALGAFNLIEPSDIDVIVNRTARKNFSEKPQALSNKVDIVSLGYHRSHDRKWLLDDEIIHDEDYHFWFYGVKICNLDLVLERKRYSARHKDILHANLIEHHFKYSSTRTNRTRHWEILVGLHKSKTQRGRILRRFTKKLKSIWAKVTDQ